MAERTALAWCHHTFNPWWGCVEVSPACDHCYAREFAARVRPGLWGKDAPRRFFGDRHWDEPLRWSRGAERAGERRRVFCASMADVLEDRDDAEGTRMTEARQRLWAVIASTPGLDWLLLSKRPQNYRRLVPAEILDRANVWPGTTTPGAPGRCSISGVPARDGSATSPSSALSPCCRESAGTSSAASRAGRRVRWSSRGSNRSSASAARPGSRYS
jgi:protein gp37